ncbi:hypothetical protein [Aquabacterium lacunae]|uniref:hypothetical protein n=1 Tax=Aquabacterium lacunae TaxID=2528630 RepID=UPI0010347C49|nr:hypothetical protein [Aquabacterium lacunae]
MPSTVASEQADTVQEPLRQALLWALGGYLSETQAQQALGLWRASPQQAAQASALAGLSRYCRSVAQQFGLQGREAELHLRIVRAIQASGAARPVTDVATSEPAARLDKVDTRPAPLEDALHSRSANDSVPPGLANLAVQRFLEAIETVVERECSAQYTPQRWRQGLLRHTARFPKHLQLQVAEWLWGHVDSLPGDWPARGAGTRLINAAYVALAEWVGPVRADAAFTQIVKGFENSADPTLSGVRRYL